MAARALKGQYSLRFEKDFPGAKSFGWSGNLPARTGHILGAAAGLIGKQLRRLGKNPVPDTAEMGNPVYRLRVWGFQKKESPGHWAKI